MPELRQGKRRVMKEFRLVELSAVDVPAQEGARALLMKRSDEVDKRLPGPKKGEKRGDFVGRFMASEAAKTEFPDDDQRLAVANERFGKSDGAMVLITSSVEGHSHAVWIHDGGRGGETSYGKGPDEEMGHSHPWAMDASGNIVVGENDGHTHDVDTGALVQAILAAKRDRGAMVSGDGSIDPNASKERTSMPDNKPSENQDLEQKVDELTKRANRAESVIALSPEHRAHFDQLEGDAADEFLGKSATERDAILRAEAEADKVVYKAADGTEFRASDDSRIVAQAKRADQAIAKAEAAEKRAEDAELRKRAETTLSHSPGTIEERMETLRAVESIQDENARETSLKQLRAGNDALKAAFESNGSTDSGGAGDETPMGQLDALVAKVAKDENLSEADAYTKVLETPEGQALYAKAVN